MVRRVYILFALVVAGGFAGPRVSLAAADDARTPLAAFANGGEKERSPTIQDGRGPGPGSLLHEKRDWDIGSWRDTKGAGLVALKRRYVPSLRGERNGVFRSAMAWRALEPLCARLRI